jgi:hypothetical protein
VNEDTGKGLHAQHDCSPFALDLVYLKDCGECEATPPGSNKAAASSSAAGFVFDGAGGGRNDEGRPAVFDARTYAKVKGRPLLGRGF